MECLTVIANQYTDCSYLPVQFVLFLTLQGDGHLPERRCWGGYSRWPVSSARLDSHSAPTPGCLLWSGLSDVDMHSKYLQGEKKKNRNLKGVVSTFLECIHVLAPFITGTNISNIFYEYIIHQILTSNLKIAMSFKYK